MTTPQGALNESTRRFLVAEIGKIFDEFIGPFKGRLNHLVMLYEVSEGSSAGAGKVFLLADIQAVINIKAA